MTDSLDNIQGAILNRNTAPHLERLDSVQALRAVAALAVVAYHTPLLGWGGVWGVDLFFVISGFIMCYVTETSGKHFLVKRIIRVVPLYWGATLLLYAVASIAPSVLPDTRADMTALIKSLLFIPFRRGAAIRPMLSLGWTLNFEMLFYVLFALSLAMSRRYRAVICSGLILALVAYGQLAQPDSIPLMVSSSTITLEFVLGMFCYYAFRATPRSSPQPPSAASKVGWCLVGAIAIACLPLCDSRDLNHRVVNVGLLAAVAFYGILRGLSGVQVPRPAVLLGDASYALYLLHPYMIYVLGKVFGAWARTGVLGYCAAGTTLLMCCVMSVLSYRYLEQPTIAFLRKRFIAG